MSSNRSKYLQGTARFRKLLMQYGNGNSKLNVGSSSLVTVCYLYELHFIFAAAATIALHAAFNTVVCAGHIYLKYPPHAVMHVNGSPDGTGQVQQCQYGSESFLHVIYSIPFYGQKCL